MQVSTIIIGNGLCGAWLGYYLKQAGSSFIVIQEDPPHSASSVASGIINPVTGRRLVKTWMIDEVMPFAADAWRGFNCDSEELMNQPAGQLIRPCNVLDFFSAPDVELAFNKRLAENADHLNAVADKESWRKYFDFSFGAGEITPCYLADVNSMLESWTAFLKKNKLLVQEKFEEKDLLLKDGGVQYRGIEAHRIIYCDGIVSASSAYFNRLPFAANKGEALIAEIPGLPDSHIFKKGMSLVPWKPGRFWIGSTYQWKFEDASPTKTFRQDAETWLQSFCKMPFKIIEHLASVRPATVERRPFAGMHPVHTQVGILNGMGTKGVSLAPYFAHQLAGYLCNGTPILPETDINRFSKTLSR